MRSRSGVSAAAVGKSRLHWRRVAVISGYGTGVCDKEFSAGISEGGLELKCFVIVSVTEYICVFAAAFVKLTPGRTESAQQSFERIEHVSWSLPVLTDVFTVLFTLRASAPAYFSSRRHRLLCRSIPVFRDFRSPSLAALPLQSALVSTGICH